MADQTPPGPKTSGRIAGVIAVVALILGGYYGVIARSAPPADGDAAKTEAAKTEAANTEAAGPEAAGSEAAKTETAKTEPEAAPPGVAAEAEIANEEAAADYAASGESASATAEAKTGDAAAPQAGTATSDAAGAAPEAEVAADGTTAPDGAASAAESGPSFDIVRVEPTGEAVVAGLAEPNAKVELLDGSVAIAEGVANERGEWAIVVEKPLPPGTHDLSIRTTSPDGKTQALSEQRVAVAVPEPGKGEALVVLNEPDAPSRVLQLPDGSEPATGAGTAQMAASEPQAGAEGTAAGTDGASAPAADASGAGGTDAAAAGMAAKDTAATDPGTTDMAAQGAGDTAPGPAGDTSVPGATADASAPGSGTDAAAAPGEAAVAATGSQPDAGEAATMAEGGDATAGAAGEAAAPGAVADAGTGTDMSTGADMGAGAGEGMTAATGEGAPGPVAAAQPAEPQPEPKVTVDAVEFENGRIYIAGSSATGGTVRIYVDGIAVGDVETDAGGRWLLESQRELTPGRHTVRADQVNKATGEVIVRAEVPFDQQVDVAILSPVVTEGGGAEGASGGGAMPGPLNVIIRRGDNLWTISRRLYGKGIRYSTIYEANADQIRNPHLIYPGQIFMLPAGDTRWTN